MDACCADAKRRKRTASLLLCITGHDRSVILMCYGKGYGAVAFAVDMLACRQEENFTSAAAESNNKQKSRNQFGRNWTHAAEPWPEPQHAAL